MCVRRKRPAASWADVPLGWGGDARSASAASCRAEGCFTYIRCALWHDDRHADKAPSFCKSMPSAGAVKTHQSRHAVRKTPHAGAPRTTTSLRLPRGQPAVEQRPRWPTSTRTGPPRARAAAGDHWPSAWHWRWRTVSAAQPREYVCMHYPSCAGSDGSLESAARIASTQQNIATIVPTNLAVSSPCPIGATLVSGQSMRFG